MQSPSLKRALDVLVAGVALVISAPLIVVVSTAILATIGRPVLFSQERPGLHGRVFLLRKFRTMADVYDDHGNPLLDERRVTRLGRFLRATSLDELPELWNVIRGDMSLVGPRPLLVEYLDRYTPDQARRHHVRPGVTGLAQIHGRNDLSWQEKFKLDIEYVDNWTLSFDIRILLRTFLAVVLRHGISQHGRVGAERFQGHPDPDH